MYIYYIHVVFSTHPNLNQFVGALPKIQYPDLLYAGVKKEHLTLLVPLGKLDHRLVHDIPTNMTIPQHLPITTGSVRNWAARQTGSARCLGLWQCSLSLLPTTAMFSSVLIMTVYFLLNSVCLITKVSGDLFNTIDGELGVAVLLERTSWEDTAEFRTADFK